MDVKEFDGVYRLLENSFPLDEYRPYEEQKALLEEPAYRIYVLRNETRQMAAMMAVWELETVSFVEHFAVDPALRGKGLGASMLEQVRLLLEKPACLEAELPENEIACRRLRFYQRNGFFVNDYPYMQPPISKGRKPVPLKILTYGRPVSQEEFEKIRAVLYSRVYHCR
jgi:GNAT superfamily N-acetyltransferase